MTLEFLLKFTAWKTGFLTASLLNQKCFCWMATMYSLAAVSELTLRFQRLCLEFSRKVRGDFRRVQWFSFKSRSYCWLWEDDQPFLIDSVVKISLENWENLHPSG